MKAKRINIIYLNNGNMHSTIAKETMFNRVINDLVEEGREIESTVDVTNHRSVRFEDGSKVNLIPLGTGTLGMRVTHLYIDEAILVLPNGKNLVNQVYLPSIVEGEYNNLDTEGSPLERINLFRSEDDDKGLALTKYTIDK